MRMNSDINDKGRWCLFWWSAKEEVDVSKEKQDDKM